MARKPLSDEMKARILQLRAQGLSVRKVAAMCGVSVGSVSNVGAEAAEGPAAVSGTPEVWDEKGDSVTFNGVTDRPIRSEEDAVREFKIDLERWLVERMQVKAWTVGMKVGSKEAGFTPVRQQQYGVTLWLKRRLPKATQDALDIVFARFRDAAPKWPKVDRDRAAKGEPFLALFGLFDVHFGKYCWADETGENYDLKIAESVFANAVEDLLAECKHRPISKFLLPFGHDFLHFDSRELATTRGTKQDVDGRFSKVLATAKVAAINAVEKMAAVAPVQVELVSGNHDRSLSECLCHMLDARFHHTDRVVVNTSPKTRKYVRFGTTLLGLTHGDMVKADKLPGLMAAEAKRDWADTTCHEWVIGHGHRSQKWVTKDTDTQQGTVVRMLRALTKTDLWHYDSGFVSSPEYPAAEVYFYGRDRGYAGHALVPARGG